MESKVKRVIAMEADFSADVMPAFLSMAEKTALAYGLDKKSVMNLRLAAEEVFSYLSTVSDMHDPVRIEFVNGCYYVQVNFLFSSRRLNLHAFNLTADINPADEAQIHDIGLLIAARLVDQIQFVMNPEQKMCLSLYKEKSYPAGTALETLSAINVKTAKIETPASDDLKIFCMRVLSYYSPDDYPAFIAYPGKFVDMIYSGDYEAAMAFDEQKNILGGIFWQKLKGKTINFYGPYLFAESPDCGSKLLEFCLEKVGRSDCPGIMSRMAFEGETGKYFEILGSTQDFRPDGSVRRNTAVYRQLIEDLGARVMAHPQLMEFLKTEYSRLYLPRNLQASAWMGEKSEDHSVFAADFSQSQVTLRALLGGRDAEENLANHLKLFDGEGIKNIFFELDLGESWQSELVPALQNNQFLPCFLMPYAGRGDVVVFQHQAGDFR